MKKIPSKPLAFLAALLLTVSLVMPTFAAPPAEPTSAYFVNDFSDVLSAETENAIVADGEALARSGGPEIVLATVDFTDGMDVADYALELANSWGIGDAERNDGVLILMVPGAGTYHAIQGVGMEDTLTSGDMKLLLNQHMQADFDAGNYDAAALNTYRAFVERVGGSGPGTDAASSGGSTASQTQALRYVYDETGTLSEGTLRYIENLGEDTRRQANASVMVAVLAQGGADLDETALEFGEKMGADGNTILFVIFPQEDDFRYFKGEYIEKQIKTKEEDKILDNQTEDAFLQRDYDTAAKVTAEAFSQLLVEKFGEGAAAGGAAGQGQNQGGGFFQSIGRGISSIFSTLLVFALVILFVVVCALVPRRRYYRRYYGVPFNPFSRRYVRRYGPGGYWGRWGGPRPGYHHTPPPRGHGGGFGSGPGFGGSSGGGRPTVGGGLSGNSRGRKTSSSEWGFGGSFGGGSFRGGGAGSSGSRGRRSGGSSFGGGSFGGGSRGGGSFGGGSRGGGGGSFRGGGAGRGRGR